IGAVAIASILPVRHSLTEASIAAIDARPDAADTAPNLTGSLGLLTSRMTGASKPLTLVSATAFKTISGPIPEGSPIVIPTRGLSGLPSARVTGIHRREVRRTARRVRRQRSTLRTQFRRRPLQRHRERRR